MTTERIFLFLAGAALIMFSLRPIIGKLIRAMSGDNEARDELKDFLLNLIPKLMIAGIIVGVFLWLYFH